MSHHLYQLWGAPGKKAGDHFPVNGPWDKNGYVLKTITEDCAPERPGQSLYLIRGTGEKFYDPITNSLCFWRTRGWGVT